MLFIEIYKTATMNFLNSDYKDATNIIIDIKPFS